MTNWTHKKQSEMIAVYFLIFTEFQIIVIDHIDACIDLWMKSTTIN